MSEGTRARRGAPRARPWRAAALAGALLLATACGGSRTLAAAGGPDSRTQRAAGGDPGGAPGDAGAPTGPPAACVAFDSDEVDPLRRWLPAFPLARGGVVLTFTSPSADPMEAEAVLEMRGIEGYDVVGCGSGAVVWVPGVDCEGQEADLVEAIEQGSMLSHYGTACFRLDEVRPRLAEECLAGRLPAGLCGR